MNQTSFDTHSKPSYNCLLGIVVLVSMKNLFFQKTASRLKTILVKLIDSGKISADSKITLLMMVVKITTLENYRISCNG